MSNSNQANDDNQDLRQLTEDEAKHLVPIVQDDGTKVLGSRPPINRIVMPSTKTKSALIRWLHALGYPTKEIYVYLNVKYQMVRNIVTTEPKRAAREDLPPLEVRWLPELDIIDHALDGALEQALLTERKERKANEQQEGEEGES